MTEQVGFSKITCIPMDYNIGRHQAPFMHLIKQYFIVYTKNKTSFQPQVRYVLRIFHLNYRNKMTIYHYINLTYTATVKR